MTDLPIIPVVLVIGLTQERANVLFTRAAAAGLDPIALLEAWIAADIDIMMGREPERNPPPFPTNENGVDPKVDPTSTDNATGTAAASDAP